MADFLMRDQAPLTAQQWDALDQTVTEVARRILVGRRFITVAGPLGAGVQAIAADTLTGVTPGVTSLIGDEEGDLVRVESRRIIALPIIYKDFRLHWRDVEISQQSGMPMDVGPAAAAAAMTARAEDNLIFNGDPSLGFEGLLTVPNRTTVSRSDWDQAGKAFDDVVAAVSALTAAGFVGPFAAVLSPRLYASIHRVYANTGVLEVEQIRQLLTDGVYQSVAVPEPTALVIATGPENMDLAIAQDLTTAFLQTDNMNHYFRVLEILALRIKRPGAICAIA